MISQQKNATGHYEKEIVEPFEENKDVCLMWIKKVVYKRVTMTN